MNDNNKFPATLEEIKQDIIFRRGTKYRLNELSLITEESAIRCMDELAERYEKRIAELENGLRFFTLLSEDLKEHQHIVGGIRNAKELLEK